MKANAVHNSTQRVLNIFNLLVENDNPRYTLSEIAEKLAAPKSSLLPILQTLAANNYLQFHQRSKTYSIGRRLFEAGMCYVRSNSLSSDIQRVLDRVVSACNEACSYAELDGSEALVLMRVESPEPVKMHSNIGKRIPIYCSAMGKALMSGKSADDIRALLSGELISFTPNTITDTEIYIRSLNLMKREGFFRDNGEHTHDVQAIAVPIKKNGAVAAAVSIAVPSYRFTDQKELVCKQTLIEAKREIESLLDGLLMDGMSM